MNSYPIELLVQHAPLMFVAGLDVPPSKQDPFHSLIVRLREVLSARPKGLVWDKNRASAFNILLVEKNLRLPPRKTAQPQANTHSPLSPLTQGSPLYPDGLIAPVWIRKHVELVPSIFVLFLRLWEAPPPLSPLDGRDKEMEDERYHDQELANELAARKRTLAERGIKLTAVLLASRKLLDDPGLDARLTFLRRQSSLDARAALFVLSPVNSAELQDFIRSLTEALREPSLEYYAAHSKRVRRKRNKHSNSAYSGYAVPAVATTRVVPLRPIGWTVRYEYKLGTFAEFRFEEEVARKHYEDCWNTLSEMFSSTVVLPPRTKRWAEAKVLADCIAIKIYKLYLYNSEHALALAFFNRHVKRFCELSKTWNIGEDTFEYWSWLARQFRILAELLEIALRSGLRLPSLVPQPPEDRPAQQLALDTPSIPGRAPSTTLQHPGYYYFQAAKCTEERLRRFKAMEDSEARQPTTLSQSPAFNNERKVDHWEIILELYSKAYEQFKKYAAGQSRLTFFVAVQIATTYHSSGKHDLAVKFFERIVKAYHKERWPVMLEPIMAMWYDSAKQLGSTETCARLLIERMSIKDQTDNDTLTKELIALIKDTEPSPGSLPLTIDLSPAEHIVSVRTVFYENIIPVARKAPFQVTISAPLSTTLHLLSVASMTFHFSNDIPSMIVKHMNNDNPPRTVSLGEIDADATEPAQASGAFTIVPGGFQVLMGSISSSRAIELRVKKITLRLTLDNWTIDINFDPLSVNDFAPAWLHLPEEDFKPISLDTEDSSSVAFRQSPHDFRVDIKHRDSALVGEEYPITVSIHNQDQRLLDISFDVLLQPAENDTVNYISIGEERSTSLLRAIPFGILQHNETAEKTIFLISTGGTGKHVLDFSIQSRISGEDAESTTTSETLRTLMVDTQEPFTCDFHVTYGQPRSGLPAYPNVMDLGEEDAWSSQAYVTTVIECIADCNLEVLDITLLDKGTTNARLLHSSLSPDQSMVWHQGDQFAIDSCIGISTPEVDDFALSRSGVPSPVVLQITWKRAAMEPPLGNQTITTISLPDLNPPTIGLTAIIDPPAIGKLHNPFNLTLSIRNNDIIRSADLTIALESNEGFVVAGIKSGTIPLLLPGTEDSLTFTLIPLSAGAVKLPTFKVNRAGKLDQTTTGRSSNGATLGDAVPIVDERWNETDEAGSNVRFYASDGTALAELDLTLWLSVLVVR